MGIAAALMGLKAVEESIVLSEALADLIGMRTDKSSRSIKAAYVVTPGLAKSVEPPCVLNFPDSIADEGGLGQENEETTFTVQINVLAPADPDNGPLQATAFFEALYKELRHQRLAGLRLGNNVSLIVLRTEAEILKPIAWNGNVYPGYVFFADLTVFEATND